MACTYKEPTGASQQMSSLPAGTMGQRIPKTPLHSVPAVINETCRVRHKREEKGSAGCTHASMILERRSLRFRPPERRLRPLRLLLPSSHSHCVLPPRETDSRVNVPVRGPRTKGRNEFSSSIWGIRMILCQNALSRVARHFPSRQGAIFHSFKLVRVPLDFLRRGSNKFPPRLRET